MKASIYKSHIKGSVAAPPSKSYTLRGLLCAALTKGRSRLQHPLGSDDTEAALGVLEKLGVPVSAQNDDWAVDGGVFHGSDSDLYCRESAVTLRFMTAISAIIPGDHHLTAAPSLQARPIAHLLDALRQLGVACSLNEDKSVTVHGGELRGGTVELQGDISSQYVSALLLISPFAEEGITIRLTTSLESRPYVEMTIECLEKFGIRVNASPDMREFNAVRQAYQPTDYQVEGDWSSASYLLALGALAGETETGNLNPKSLQGDKIIVRFLSEMDADVRVGRDSVKVKQSPLRALEADLTDYTDLLPTVAVLAAAARGTSVLRGIARARLKESDRVAAVTDNLRRLGIAVSEEKNTLSITGGNCRHAVIDSHGDHRMAMAFGVLGTAVGNIEIQDAECVSKTYPEFWDTLRTLGGEVEFNGK